MDDKSKYVEDIILEPFNKISETVIFKRLVFEGEILGVLTVQSYEKDIYDRRHTAIIDLITPYLAIAVNNSIKSHNLEKEIKEREKAEEKLKEKNDILREISNTDSLTTLHNRHYLNKIMDNLFGIENIKGKNINLIMVDIDFFKEYNDTYGHIAGDEAISKIGRKIKEICEKNCIDAFRYGGDEFLIIDYDYSLNELRALGEKVNREVENLKINNLKSPISDYITVSIGITQVELENECNQDKLIKKVDNALYESKRIGKNKVTFL
jgi:diguanylate cyclase (GGDEF)-like protein